jgi:hypothetical protein
MPAVHDRGGVPTNEPIKKTDHPIQDWEVRIDGLRAVLARKGLLKTDEMRRAIEALPKEKYESIEYYAKWAEAVEAILVEKGVVSRKDLDRRMKGQMR